MEARELRIGNWLMGSVPVQVSSIINENCIGLDAGGNPYYVHAEKPFVPCLVPIELTEQWLLDFGFIKTHRCKFQKDELTYDIYVGDGLYMYGVAIEIKHVHQLQNLYFALTGEELTLNKSVTLK